MNSETLRPKQAGSGRQQVGRGSRFSRSNATSHPAGRKSELRGIGSGMQCLEFGFWGFRVGWTRRVLGLGFRGGFLSI